MRYEKTVLLKNADPNALTAFLRRVPVVCHDFKTLLRTLHIPGEGIECAYDTMLAAYLLNPGKGKYRLRDAASEYGVTALDGTAGDASLVRGLYAATKDRLAEVGMDKLLSDIEIPLSSVLSLEFVKEG